MAGKYKPHILDDETFRRSFEMYNDADWYRYAANQLAQIGATGMGLWDDANWYKEAADRIFVNQPLGDMGRGELELIGSGRFADTLLGKAYGEAERGLKESSALEEESLLRRKARDVEAAKRAGGMGAAAMMRSGNTPGSVGAGILYDRMLQKRTGEIQDRASDELSRGRAELTRGLTSLSASRAAAMPGYVSQAGEWAEAPNRGVREQAAMRGLYDQGRSNALQTTSRNIAQQAALRNMYDQAKSNATATRLSTMTFEQGKSLWDKIMKGVNDVGQIGTTIASLGGLFGVPGLKGK
jgi:hypothetical protein